MPSTPPAAYGGRPLGGRGHRIRDIAEQSGLSAATVDRVLHARAGVSSRAVRQVEQAMLDLDRQQTQLRLGAKTLLLDVVMAAPSRFTSAVREALEREVVALRPATIRVRFHLGEHAGPEAVDSMVERLSTVGRRGRHSQGVLLKAPDDPRVAAAARQLSARGIPVVTLVTDVGDSGRIAYAGLDNAAAGATAAYLLQQWLGVPAGAVLVTLSRSTFLGEQERRVAFERTLARLDPAREVIVLSDADGLDEGMSGLVRGLLEIRRDIAGVYSVGGGNRAIAAELDRAEVRLGVFLGHDLDADNVELLRAGVLSAVLHHDLRADLRRACEQILRYHRLLPGAPTSSPSQVDVITPHNIPWQLVPR